MPSINLQLASYSDLFMLIAALVYAAAFIVFAIDMATSSKAIRTLEAELAAGEADAGASAGVRREQLVGAGGSGAGHCGHRGTGHLGCRAARRPGGR